MSRKKVPGSIVQIPLHNGLATYARELRHPFLAVYDARDLSPDDLGAIVARPVLFTIAVQDSAFRAWHSVGRIALRENELPIPEQFIQDMFIPTDCRILDASGVERRATLDECRGLEPAAIWEADHVVERIESHYAGKASSFLKSLELKIV